MRAFVSAITARVMGGAAGGVLAGAALAKITAATSIGLCAKCRATIPQFDRRDAAREKLFDFGTTRRSLREKSIKPAFGESSLRDQLDICAIVHVHDVAMPNAIQISF